MVDAAGFKKGHGPHKDARRWVGNEWIYGRGDGDRTRVKRMGRASR